MSTAPEKVTKFQMQRDRNTAASAHATVERVRGSNMNIRLYSHDCRRRKWWPSVLQQQPAGEAADSAPGEQQG